MGTKYTTQSDTGYNASFPSDDGAETQNNKVTWAKHKTKLADPIRTLAQDINTTLVNAFDVDTLAKSGAYTTVADDDGRTIECTSSPTITLGAAATMATGYVVTVKCVSGTTTVATSDTIDGSASNRTLAAGDSETYRVNTAASAYLIDSSKGVGASETATLTNKTLTAPVINGAITGDAASTDLSSSAAGDEYAYADAIKTYADAAIVKGATITQNPYAASFSGSVSHTLGKIPDLIRVELVCIKVGGANGYSENDSINYSSGDQSASGSNKAISVSATSTTMYYSTSSGNLNIVPRAGGTAVTITAAEWKVVVTPYAFSYI